MSDIDRISRLDPSDPEDDVYVDGDPFGTAPFDLNLSDSDGSDDDGLDFSERKLDRISNDAPFTPIDVGTPSKDKGYPNGRGRRPSDASLSSSPNAR